MNKGVGIVIPSYNQHGYLSQAVDSVLSQSHRDYHLIIVNDYQGKGDSPEKQIELEGLVKERDDSRIELVVNEQNKGIAGTRNVAIQKLIGMGVEYIFLLDHDDIWIDSDKIKEQLRVLKQGEIGVLGTQFEVVDAVGRLIGKSFHPQTHDEICKAILLSCPMLMSTIGVNAQVFDNNGFFNERYNGTDDWEFLMRILKHNQGGNLPTHSVHYRYALHNTSQTDWHRLVKEQLEVLLTQGVGYKGYHRALLITYLKLLMPTKYKLLFRRAKKYLIPGYEGYSINDSNK